MASAKGKMILLFRQTKSNRQPKISGAVKLKSLLLLYLFYGAKQNYAYSFSLSKFVQRQQVDDPIGVSCCFTPRNAKLLARIFYAPVKSNTG